MEITRQSYHSAKIVGDNTDHRLDTNGTLMTLIKRIFADRIIFYHNYLRHLRSIISF